MPLVPARILPTIVASQFAATSLWFAGNAVLPDLQQAWRIPDSSIGAVTIAVQLGFIAGTLVFAWLAVADRFSPRLVFFACTLAGAAANAIILLASGGMEFLLVTRFATGFFLAGIYPIGMKIASGWYDRNLGFALGWLVGALVLGTALPHLVRGLGSGLPWENVVAAVSVLALCGGLAMLVLVPDGPHLGANSNFDPKALFSIFRSADFRASAFGYFGHMWELYAFYAFVPILLAVRLGDVGTAVPLWSFAVIASGVAGCIAGGYVSRSIGNARVARLQLTASGACCLLSPAAFVAPLPVFLGFLVLWGVVIAGDSPQFSALNARFAPAGLVGSALTIANCIGFSITIASISVLSRLIDSIGPQYAFVVLAIGPIIGVSALRRLAR